MLSVWNSWVCVCTFACLCVYFPKVLSVAKSPSHLAQAHFRWGWRGQVATVFSYLAGNCVVCPALRTGAAGFHLLGYKCKYGFYLICDKRGVVDE